MFWTQIAAYRHYLTDLLLVKIELLVKILCIFLVYCFFLYYVCYLRENKDEYITYTAGCGVVRTTASVTIC